MDDEWDGWDEVAWGPKPSRWEMIRANFWNWRVQTWRRTVCRLRGHTKPIYVPNYDAPGGADHCKRCGRWRDDEGKWHP